MTLFDNDENSPELFPVKKPIVSAGEIKTVFKYWVEKHQMSERCALKGLTPMRKTRIHNAIRDYGMKTTLSAIDGCLKSDWHMGDNPTGVKYNDVSLILRDDTHIERFAKLADENGGTGGFLRDWQ